VLGGELIVNTNERGDLYSMNGEVSPNLSLQTQPTIDSARAAEIALQAMAKWYQRSPEDFAASEPELWIYDESLLRPSTRPVELVWRMEVIAKDNAMPVRELVLVNAERGGISLHFNQIDTAWDGKKDNESNTHVENIPALAVATWYAATTGNDNNINGSYMVSATVDSLAGSADFQLINGLQVSTYTANLSSSLPGTFLCDQTQPNCTNGGNPHADAAHKYAIGTYDFYANNFLRDSIDNNGMSVISTVQYCDPFFSCPYNNAYWSGAQMVYGSAYGFPLADDIVAHELTHGVTQYESNLFYYYQSGAINESFSDLWGEYYDQSNGQGNDTAGVKWLLGEDVTGLGAIRSMSDPPQFGHPDKMSSTYYYEGGGDSGGVHTNSGVNNKAVYLMVDGGTFNGRTVTALGWEKTGAIYYEVNTNLLTSGADYSDLYYALQQACSNLVGQHGITAGDCVEVKDAADAVEMNGQPASNFNTNASVCSTGLFPSPVFADDLESGTSNWTFTNGAYTRWQLDSPFFGPYAHSGLHSLYADDYPQAVTDARATLTAVVVPANARLIFHHAYEFEYYAPNIDPNFYDGGVLEYSINGGGSWVDAGSLIDFNGYKGVIYPNYINPLKGRSAFVGTSHGYISTRLNLASLAGKTVNFRWRMGTDDYVTGLGWWVDDVMVYTCASGLTISGNAGVAGATLSYDDGGAKTATSLSNGSYSLQVSPGWSGMVTPTHPCYTFDPTDRTYTNVTANQSGQNYTASLDPASGCAETEVTIGGNTMDTYTLQPNTGQVLKYPVDGGPVEISAQPGAKIIASLNQWRKRPGTSQWTGVSQSMALPVENVSNIYVMPRYDYTSPIRLYNAVLLANVDTVPRDITVTIGGTVMGTYTIGPSQSEYKTYSGVAGGPVVVSSDSGAKIIASIYELRRDPNFTGWNGQSEMMGLPWEGLSDSYVIPIYFGAPTNQNLDARLFIANADTVARDVTVKIGGNTMGTYTLQPNTGQVLKYPVDGGPVEISAQPGAKIIASLNQWRKRPGTSQWTGVSQSMALPLENVSNIYVMPRYDYSNPTRLYNAVLLANVDTVPRDITVTIGGTVMGTYTIGPSQSEYKTYSGVAGGPVVVSSDSGAKIIASIYELRRDPNFTGWNGQSEMMGLPWQQLSDSYVIPIYFGAPTNQNLDARLFIAVP
jgi:Zn-dependent metalloprotease